MKSRSKATHKNVRLERMRDVGDVWANVIIQERVVLMVCRCALDW